MPIRVLVVDDQPLFREGLMMLLEADSELELIGEAGSGEQAIEVVATRGADVVLMDLRMPGMGGVAATAQLAAIAPRCRVLVLSTFDDDDSVFQALRAGAVGYLLKDSSAVELRRAVHRAAAGESPLQPAIAAKVIGELTRRMGQDPMPAGLPAQGLLSERERDVLRLIAAGASNKVIAGKLFIAEGTVKNHVTRIFEKLEVEDRTQAALKARDLGII